MSSFGRSTLRVGVQTDASKRGFLLCSYRQLLDEVGLCASTLKGRGRGRGLATIELWTKYVAMCLLQSHSD